LDADRHDEVEWALEKSKSFTTKSLYKFLMHRGVQVKDAENIWKTSLPMKIKVFLWQLSLNKLQSAVTLKRRGWKGSTRCVLCGRQESVSHIFFSCSFACFVWACLSEVFGEAIPSYWGELQGGKLTSMFKTNMRLSLFLLQGSLGRPFGEHATRWLSKGHSLIIVLMLCTRLFLSYRNGGDR